MVLTSHSLVWERHPSEIDALQECDRESYDFSSREINCVESRGLFESDFYNKLNTFTLSTSQVVLNRFFVPPTFFSFLF